MKSSDFDLEISLFFYSHLHLLYSSPDAKTVTLELYVNKEEKNRTTYKKYETGTEDTYGEGVGRVYESDEDPLDLYSLVEGKIEIKIR